VVDTGTKSTFGLHDGQTGRFFPLALYKQAHLLKCYEIWHEACMLKVTFSESVLTDVIDIVTS